MLTVAGGTASYAIYAVTRSHAPTQQTHSHTHFHALHVFQHDLRDAVVTVPLVIGWCRHDMRRTHTTRTHNTQYTHNTPCAHLEL
jgi:hypothetical protein